MWHRVHLSQLLQTPFVPLPNPVRSSERERNRDTGVSDVVVVVAVAVVAVVATLTVSQERDNIFCLMENLIGRVFLSTHPIL